MSLSRYHLPGAGVEPATFVQTALSSSKAATHQDSTLLYSTLLYSTLQMVWCAAFFKMYIFQVTKRAPRPVIILAATTIY